MKTIIAILGVLLLSNPFSTKNGIDYQHKRFLKTFYKLAGDDASMHEIHIPDSIVFRFNIHGKYFSVNSKNTGNPIKYIYVGRVNSCRAGGCSGSMDIEKNIDHEYFDYAIFYKKDLSVFRVNVFSYQATHGHEITARGWLKQFRGYQAPVELNVGKDIDGISGATISVQGITFDIQLKTRILKSHVVEEFLTIN